MYNKKSKRWICEDQDEEILLWCEEPFNKENPKALYILADQLLDKATKGDQVADAVYKMETAAKKGYDKAALAMGQMFQYGWRVHASWKLALKWYEEAAKLGNPEAEALLAAIRRQQRQRRMRLVLAGVLVIAAAIITILLWPEKPPVGVLVDEETELIEPVTQDEFIDEMSKLVEEHDTELVISGQQSTNRLLLKFEGTGIDLSDFPAATVIADDDNYLVIQFESEEEAQECLSALRKMDQVLFVDVDEYNSVENTHNSVNMLSSTAVPYVSPYTGVAYYSWGVEYLGMDQLAAWIGTQPTKPVTVAVVDTGVEPCDENRHRILEGIDVVYTERTGGWTDNNGHGTHVAGTIIDCTWGLDVSVLPVQVFYDSGSAATWSIVEGLKYAIDQSVDVVNMSLGGGSEVCFEDPNSMGAEDYYISEAVSKGIVVVVAAGNGDEKGNPMDTYDCCPAHIEECIVVGACDSRGQLASFSNYGDSVDVCAPGVAVLSYYPGDQLAELDGTSMAAPHVSALVAMMKQYLPEDKTPAQFEKYIEDYCVDLGFGEENGEGIPWAGYLAGE